MSYNPNDQFRAIIVRGRSQERLDDLLPAYASIINEICPCSASEFAERFNKKLAQLLPGTRDKTLDNHRTENACKLLGLAYQDEKGDFHVSDRTLKLLGDGDQPALFKEICLKMQFPNGMNKAGIIRGYINEGIKIRQFAFILKLLLLAREASATLTAREIYYYALNSKQVLQGLVSPEDVLAKILDDRRAGIVHEVAGHNSSHATQHLREQLKLLSFANLIRIDSDQIFLNEFEQRAINYIAETWERSLGFDVNAFDVTTSQGVKDLQIAWQLYYSSISEDPVIFATTPQALSYTPPVLGAVRPSPTTGMLTTDTTTSTTVIGDAGVMKVLEYERARVSAFNPRLLIKIKNVSNFRGVGYDVSSVLAEAGPTSDFAIYIEVKTSMRTTPPPATTNFPDSFKVTRNEWSAARQFKEFFYIYRVFITSSGVYIYKIKNPSEKNMKGVIQVEPLEYSVDFDLGLASDQNLKI
jgi:hypothetical protein